jgi:3'-phosphoadenosine 5'-phosphosulfate sulfotransferase (PAPS reductase)/FAD synthetase
MVTGKKNIVPKRGPLHVVSLSGGKDSTAMLLMMLEQGMPVDRIHYADVGEMAEFEEMYAYITRVEAYTGIKVTTVRSKQYTARNIFFGYPTRGNHKEEIRGFPPTVGPGCRYRSWLKVEPLEEAAGCGNHVYIGIAADESHRSRSEEYAEGKNDYHFPLVEWGVTESACMEYLKARGLYNGLYDFFGRIGCWWCPKQPLGSLRSLWKHFPDKWARLRELEDIQGRPFKHRYPAAELEKRFAAEAENEKARQEEAKESIELEKLQLSLFDAA